MNLLCRFLIALFLICTLPLISGNKKGLVVILSETRAHELTFENIKKNLIDSLDLDVAVCIGIKEDYSYDDPFYEMAKYRFLYPEPEDFSDAFNYAFDVIQKNHPSSCLFNWREFLKIKDQFLGGIKDPKEAHPGSAGILIFFRWFLLQKLIEEDLINKYDFFIITRSDYKYRLPHPSFDLFNSDCIAIPDGEKYGGVTDRHVVLSKNNVVDYLNILEKFILNGHQYYELMKDYSYWNLESLIKFHLIQQQKWDKVQFFPYIMYSVRAVGGKTRWAEGVFIPEENCFVKYLSEYFISENHLRDFISESQDIDTFYKNRIQ